MMTRESKVAELVGAAVPFEHFKVAACPPPRRPSRSSTPALPPSVRPSSRAVAAPLRHSAGYRYAGLDAMAFEMLCHISRSVRHVCAADAAAAFLWQMVSPERMYLKREWLSQCMYALCVLLKEWFEARAGWTNSFGPTQVKSSARSRLKAAKHMDQAVRAAARPHAIMQAGVCAGARAGTASTSL